MANQKISIPQLSEAHQREFGRNLKWLDVSKEGPDHCPQITVVLGTDFGKFTATGEHGQGQKIVKQLAAQKAWDERYA